jgi:riboflavin synthase
LSVVEADTKSLAFDVIPTSLARTTLGAFKEGTPVNLEHAARADSLLDGHIVQGHIDGVGDVLAVDESEGYCLSIGAPAGVAEHVCLRGSIAVDGVSLTIAAVESDRFDVALIPTTLEETSLSSLRAGDRVNLEADVFAKLVAQHVARLLATQED